MKAGRNKTIDLSVEDGRRYLERCVRITEKADLGQILDKTVIGDALGTLPLLPDKFADLLIVDPPYNLAKDFHEKNSKKSPMICMRNTQKPGFAKLSRS